MRSPLSPGARAARASRSRGLLPGQGSGQCVREDRVASSTGGTRGRDEAGVRQQFGVPPASMPDSFALVGDSADGFPGHPGWGDSRSRRLCSPGTGTSRRIPAPTSWHVSVRGATKFAATLAEQHDSSPSSSEASRRCAPMRPSAVAAAAWSPCAGPGRGPSSGHGPGASARPSFTSAPPCWRPRAAGTP